MERLVEDLRGLADMVLIDTPPVLAVSDTLPVARMVDGVIIVSDAGATTRSALRHVREQLEQVGARIVGGIYNGFDPTKAGSDGYYGYGGYEESSRRRDDEVEPIPTEKTEAQQLWD
jgi:non-specific protein-tyrosine kinase